MNGPQDFAELKVSESKRREIALALGLWNSSNDKGVVKVPFTNVWANYELATRVRSRIRRIGKKYGMDVKF